MSTAPSRSSRRLAHTTEVETALLEFVRVAAVLVAKARATPSARLAALPPPVPSTRPLTSRARRHQGRRPTADRRSFQSAHPTAPAQAPTPRVISRASTRTRSLPQLRQDQPAPPAATSRTAPRPSAASSVVFSTLSDRKVGLGCAAPAAEAAYCPRQRLAVSAHVGCMTVCAVVGPIVVTGGLRTGCPSKQVRSRSRPEQSDISVLPPLPPQM